MEKFKPKSFHLQWHITERCNLKCKHCYQDPVFLKKEINTRSSVNILKDFIKQIKEWEIPKQRVKISLTGGEPFVRKDFFNILEECYKNRDVFQYGILTNGTFLDKEKIKKIEQLGVSYVQISLEGMEKINDYIRGKGVFKKVIKSIELLKKTKIDLNFAITVTRLNLKEVPKIINLAKELEIGLGIRRCVSCGSGKKIEKFFLKPEEIKLLWHYVLKVKQNFWNQIGLGCEDDILIQDFPQYQAGSCSAGYVSFTVLPNADVYPCRRLPLFCGNLLKQSFKDVYYNSDILKKLRNKNNINDVCFSCSFFEKCHGGAKCVSFGHFQDFTAPDPQCWRLFKKLPDQKIKWENNSEKREEKLDFRWIER
jgi:radical SAM protein with 4Fe4S-binding SPASM domain